MVLGIGGFQLLDSCLEIIHDSHTAGATVPAANVLVLAGGVTIYILLITTRTDLDVVIDGLHSQCSEFD